MMLHRSLPRRDFLKAIAAIPALAPPQRAGWDQDKLREAAEHVQRWVDDGRLRAASLLVQRGDHEFGRAFGEARDRDAIFLLASITKPMTAAGVMILVDRGELALSDPVHRFIPEFTGGDRRLITIRHLLTHTSGLPDQLPENVELRRRHAPLGEFVERTIRTPLLFKPGERVEYQSMGILLAYEVAQRMTGRAFRDFLQDELFRPLGMTRTALGLGQFTIAETAQSQVDTAPGEYGGGGVQTGRWDWNSTYWRNLGVPWGGAHSTGPDLVRFLRYFLHPDDRIMQKDTAALMVTNQNQGLDTPWGIGFAVDSPNFGCVCSPHTFGHYGATGTLAWADPDTNLIFVFLTTLPYNVSRDGLIDPVSRLASQA
jgi:CubicO group peptidase (beta-lactamase class C family)